jgi:hypothetical protein
MTGQRLRNKTITGTESRSLTRIFAFRFSRASVAVSLLMLRLPANYPPRFMSSTVEFERQPVTARSLVRVLIHASQNLHRAGVCFDVALRSAGTHADVRGALYAVFPLRKLSARRPLKTKFVKYRRGNELLVLSAPLG